MDLDQFLTDLQASYVAEFVAAHSAESGRHEKLGSEIALEIAGGVYRNLYVADFVVQQNGAHSIIELTPTSRALRGPADFEDGDFTIHFASVSWDAMTFHFSTGALAEVSLETWFDRWLDVERIPESGSVTTGIIHSMVVGTDSLSIDFGTAPIAAAEELLELLWAEGAQFVRVESSRN